LKRVLLVLLLVLILGAAGGVGYGWFLVSQPYRGHTGSVIVEIPPGFGSEAITDLLIENGIIQHRMPALAYLYFSSHRGKLQAGEYEFDQALDVEGVFSKLARGDIRLHKFTVPEGLILEEIADLWQEAELGDRAGFIEAASEVLPLVREIDGAAVSVEGYLFPETYSFRKDVTAGEAVQSMIRGFESAVHRLETAIDRDDWPLDLTDALILASLIESEAAVADERVVISSVFHNRLRRGMLLECDPTVIYALRLDGSYRGRLLRKDLDFDSPYNTYRYPKLPPGPIANPGYQSLLAAISPVDSDFLFFVRTDGGRHTFSRTLAEHNRAVAAYRRSR
jgi:UPF0755 protein